MSTRALIIAIEDYPESRQVSRTLEGTAENAAKFAQCIESELQIPKQQIFFCSSGESEYITFGSKREDIKKAVTQLLQQGANATNRLIVYLSGHGIMKPGEVSDPHTHVLLCSDFKSSRESGDACIQIEDLTTLLSRGLGAGTHLAFIDACRTVDNNIRPTEFGINPEIAQSGTANQFHLVSAKTGDYAPNDSLFVDTLIDCLNGNTITLVPDEKVAGSGWVTFQQVAKQVEKQMAEVNRSIEIRSVAEKSDYRIRRVNQPGPTATILDVDSRKAPPVELLTTYDEVIFLGETNSQLAGKPRDKDWNSLDQPNFLELAFTARERRPWQRLEIFSIEDLSTAGRIDRTLAELEQERDEAEEYLKTNAARIAQELRIYRYEYAGTYASLWTANDGKRRVHTSARKLGVDIRMTPSQDFIDFPGNHHPIVNDNFEFVNTVLAQPSTHCLFEYPLASGT